MSATKRCSKCGKTKPVSEFCKDRGKKDGLNVYCRDCVRARNWGGDPPPKPVPPAPGMRKCARCQETKPVAEFSKRTSSKDGLEYYCRACCGAAVRAHNQANRDAKREYSSRYRLANLKQKREYWDKYYRANAEQLRARSSQNHWANRDAKLEYQAKYRKANYERLRKLIANYMKSPAGQASMIASQHKRRAAKLGSIAKLTPEQRKASRARIAYIKYQAPTCAHCGKEFGDDRSDVCVDHIKPLALGGGEEASNLQALCRPCNSRKGARFEG